MYNFIMASVIMLGDMLRPQPSVCRYAECQYPEWHYVGVIRLNVNILYVIDGAMKHPISGPQTLTSKKLSSPT